MQIWVKHSAVYQCDAVFGNLPNPGHSIIAVQCTNSTCRWRRKDTRLPSVECND